jgi:hypothetical protein
MELTEEQIRFLNKVCGNGKWTLNENGEVDVTGIVNMANMKLTEIPVKFGKVNGSFYCENNKLTNLKNCPTSVSKVFYFHGNNLTEYFKNIKEEDFTLWENLVWLYTLQEYPFLVNICKKYSKSANLKYNLNEMPNLKLYLE